MSWKEPETEPEIEPSSAGSISISIWTFLMALFHLLNVIKFKYPIEQLHKTLTYTELIFNHIIIRSIFQYEISFHTKD